MFRQCSPCYRSLNFGSYFQSHSHQRCTEIRQAWEVSPRSYSDERINLVQKYILQNFKILKFRSLCRGLFYVCGDCTFLVLLVDDEFVLKSNTFLRAHRRDTDDVVDLFLTIFVQLPHLNTPNAFANFLIYSQALLEYVILFCCWSFGFVLLAMLRPWNSWKIRWSFSLFSVQNAKIVQF